MIPFELFKIYCFTMSTYSDKEYKSGEGMLTTVWGPSLWHFLHTMSFNYPIEPTNEQKTNYMNFILNVINLNKEVVSFTNDCLLLFFSISKTD